MDPDTLEFLAGYNNWYNNLRPAKISEEMLQAIKMKQIKELIEVLVRRIRMIVFRESLKKFFGEDKEIK